MPPTTSALVVAIPVVTAGVGWLLRSVYNDLREDLDEVQATAETALAKATAVEGDHETLVEQLVDAPHDAGVPLLQRIVDRLDRIEAEQKRHSRLVTENTHNIQRIAAALEECDLVATAVEDGEVHFPEADAGGTGDPDPDDGPRHARGGAGPDVPDDRGHGRGREPDGGVPLPDDEDRAE